MTKKFSSFAVATILIYHVVAEIAPEITTINSGYHIIAKLPCTACPYLSQPASQDKNKNAPWTKTPDVENALLLNITLPFSSNPHLTINTATLLTPSPILPKIHANQVPLSLSSSDLASMIESNDLDTPGSASFALSYAYSLNAISNSPNALLFHFDVMEMYVDVPGQDVTVVLDAPAQKMLEILLLRRPLLSAGDAAPSYEMLRAELVSRDRGARRMRKMWYRDWDENGRVNTFAHFVACVKGGFVRYVNSSVWALSIFILALMGLFVVVCSLCCLAMGEGHAYEKAQARKRMRSRGWVREDEERERGRGDLETGRRMEGLLGVGKSD
ncbi:hypothetical protein NX059_001219 [Plenodomus lindquistii]|nr:hypothetical protein NX059_001219 [Plenodomus lindquistii]